VLLIFCAAISLTACGSSESGSAGVKARSKSSGSDSPDVSVPQEEAPSFANAKALAAYLDPRISSGCKRFGYVVPPGKAVHPSDEGLSPKSVGVSEESFDMNNRLIEWGACLISGHSSFGIERFEGGGLSVGEYERRLRNAILPESCRAFSDTSGMVDVIWKDDRDIWSIEPSSRDSGDVRALPIEQRKALLGEIAGLVGGVVVVHDCA
jgi:hypothetical protein